MSQVIPPIHIKELLQKYDIRPSKGLGQNFLSDPNILERIVTSAAVSLEDEVLEVGPGLGALTRYLAASAKKVVAVELDRKMMSPLAEVLAPFNNVQVVQGDILEIPPADLFSQNGYLVVANIPYYITSALIRHLLEADVKPARIVLTVQKEVATRIQAQPGDLNLLALGVQVYGKPQTMHTIPAGAFYPIPKVDSAVVSIDLYKKPLIDLKDLPLYFRLIKAGFSQKRKNLRNSLAAGMHWSKEFCERVLLASGIEPERRAQTLSMDEWQQLIIGNTQVEKEDQETIQ